MRARIQKSKFTGAEGSSLLYTSAGLLPAAQLLLVGIGGESEIANDTWRKTGARARREAAAIGAEDVALFFAPGKNAESAAAALVEGAPARGLPVQQVSFEREGAGGGDQVAHII